MLKYLIFFILPSFSYCQVKQLNVLKSATPIKIDGILDEKAWQDAEIADNFYLNSPFDSSYATQKSIAKITFDDNFIYIGATLFQDKEKITISSLKRDFGSGTTDIFIINFDTFSDQLNGFHFSVSPYNVQREALISDGDNLDISWDNKWYSQVKIQEDHWDVEIAIPFKSIRYKVKPGDYSWNFNFARVVMSSNEVSSWMPVPRNFKIHSLAYHAQLNWKNKPPEIKRNISLIPYLSLQKATDYPRDPNNLEPLYRIKNDKFAIGGDAKIALGSALNLDLTANPDFSQVEVDKQQTNLSRFELFFPEKRQFFLENADLFGNFGFPDTRPFFSRRIGILYNPKTGLTNQVPIVYGARLSGKVNQNFRIGAMNMQTKKEEKFGLPSANYTVLTAQQKVFSRSSIGGIFVNKQTNLGSLDESERNAYNAYNRVGGLEFNFNSQDNRFVFETFLHKSFTPGIRGNDLSMGMYSGYSDPNMDLNFGIQRISDDYIAEMGYVPRKGIYNIYRPFQFRFYPKNEKISSKINFYGFGVEGSDVLKLDGTYLDTENAFYLFLSTPQKSEFTFGYYYAFTNLQFEFDPTNASNNPDPDVSKDVVPLPIGKYPNDAFFINFKTSSRNKFIAVVDFWNGGYFNGKGTGLTSTFSYRWQPYGIFSLDINYNSLRLPKPYNSANYLLIGPKAELSFTRSLFLSTFFQYNTQTNNTNINCRLQYRYKPVSDIYLVFTDNYFANAIPNYSVNAWTPKNRALILKITYWFNL